MSNIIKLRYYRNLSRVPRIFTDEEVEYFQDYKDILKSEIETLMVDTSSLELDYLNLLIDEYDNLLLFLLECRDVYLKKGYKFDE